MSHAERETEESYSTVDASETSLETWAVCAICQQPVRRNESVRWRGSPVHRGCFSGLK